jgi:transcriptional regulator with XRE-family HTH domain
MRRKMLSMSQTELGAALGLTFQQVQKYEKGTNRIGAGRLQLIARTLQVPISFFFDDPIKPNGGGGTPQARSPDYVSDFLATNDGLALTEHRQAGRGRRRRGRLTELSEMGCSLPEDLRKTFAHYDFSGFEPNADMRVVVYPWRLKWLTRAKSKSIWK